MLLGIAVSSASAQNADSKPKNAPLQQSVSGEYAPSAAGIGNTTMTGAGTGSNAKLVPKKEDKKIPDGTYGTNRTGQVFSPSNPNFPYNKDGEITPSTKRETQSGNNAGKVSSNQTTNETFVMPKPTANKSK